MKKIKLTQGKYALVDDADYGWLNQWKWRYHNRYAYSTTLIKNKMTSMHQLISNSDMKNQCDHINGDKLDNRRINLRLCTPSENCANQGLNKRNTSGFKGVYWSKKDKIWKVGIRTNFEYHYLGRFKSKVEAAKKYNEAAKELHGEFAFLNKI